ncbi:MAG: hypothetical protein DME96_02700 [Verrucomicrobia bacterium]|nr:MAG: hypothetical protein DME96_02700 [Verrucomicrobiota bacterium]
MKASAPFSGVIWRISAVNYRDREKFSLRWRLILIKATSMKFAAVFIFVSLALVSQGSAVLRPQYPVKAAPPFRGDVIAIGNDALRNLPDRIPAKAPN